MSHVCQLGDTCDSQHQIDLGREVVGAKFLEAILVCVWVTGWLGNGRVHISSVVTEPYIVTSACPVEGDSLIICVCDPIVRSGDKPVLHEDDWLRCACLYICIHNSEYIEHIAIFRSDRMGLMCKTSSFNNLLISLIIFRRHDRLRIDPINYSAQHRQVQQWCVIEECRQIVMRDQIQNVVLLLDWKRKHFIIYR